MVHIVEVSLVGVHTVAKQAVHPQIQQGDWVREPPGHLINFSLQTANTGSILAVQQRGQWVLFNASRHQGAVISS